MCSSSEANGLGSGWAKVKWAGPNMILNGVGRAILRQKTKPCKNHSEDKTAIKTHLYQSNSYGEA